MESPKPPTTQAATWGTMRQCNGQHPIGASYWGLPRRPYRDGTNVRVEHARLGRSVTVETDTYELPDRYTAYLRDYALARCLGVNGPGQDRVLAAHYEQRWGRHLARIRRRLDARDRQRTGRLGADASRVGPPPRPRLPWAYGSVVR